MKGTDNVKPLLVRDSRTFRFFFFTNLPKLVGRGARFPRLGGNCNTDAS